MARPSKENDVLYCFFNYPNKEWSFTELEKATRLAPSKLSKWLHYFLDNKWIVRHKSKGAMPYYIANHEHPSYRFKKRLFGWEKLYDSGLLTFLAQLPGIKNIVLFGSFSRSDWHSESDIDFFLYGDLPEYSVFPFEQKLGREIQIFEAKDKEGLNVLGPGLLRNILSGVNLKGYIPDEVFIVAAQPTRYEREISTMRQGIVSDKMRRG